jgi:hypothetical protein
LVSFALCDLLLNKLDYHCLVEVGSGVLLLGVWIVLD